jgi:GNAT superfamily N-acetyltransferase
MADSPARKRGGPSADSPGRPIVRPSGPPDLDVIVEFNRQLALETEAKVLAHATLRAGVTHALADPERLRYFVAELGSPPRIVGQAAVTREWSDWRAGWIWWLQSVYVEQRFRGRGVFRALYDAIRGQARSRGDVIGLRLYVEDANAPAQQTYRALGMKPGGYSIYEELWGVTPSPAETGSGAQ